RLLLSEAPLTLLDPVFDRLDPGGLSEKYQSARTSGSEPDLLSSEFFLSESCRFEGQIHCEKEWLGKVSDRCLRLDLSRMSGSTRGLVAGLCVVALAENDRKRGVTLPFEGHTDLNPYFSVYQSSPPEIADRLYLDGRIAFLLLEDRKDFARGALALESL